MNDNSNDSRRSKAPWYVMCHLNPRQIEVLLRKECEGLFGKDGGERPSPFRFYIPFLYMPVAEDAEQAEYTNELRGDFRSRYIYTFPKAEIGSGNIQPRFISKNETVDLYFNG